VVTFWPCSGIVVLVLLVALLKKRGKRLWSYGTASWATARELARCIAATSGILLGRLNGNGPLVRVSPVATAIYGPVGSGKSTAFIMNWLLDPGNNESAVVLDIKGELAVTTARARQRMGHWVVLFNHFHLAMRKGEPLAGFEAASFNPFDFIP